MLTNQLVNFLTYTFVLMLVFVSSQAVAAVNVKIKVDGDKLVVHENNSPCTMGVTDDPCILVKAGSKPHMFFKLVSAEGGDVEDACETVGYKLTNFRISMVNKFWPSPAWPLNPLVAADFNANPLTGYLYWSNPENSVTDKQIKLKNFNNHVYSVFYEVTAKHCEKPEEEIYLDPEIRNKGND